MDGEVVLSVAGRIAREEWLRTAEVRPSVVLDAFVVMPDHVHLLFGVVPEDEASEPSDHRRDTPTVCPHPPNSGRRFGHAVARSVPSIMRQYKSIVTKRIWATLGRGTGPVWQGRYHDRVVRTDREAAAIRRYIADNPARWDPDADRADRHRA